MTQSEYNQHVTRCAQFVLGLHPGDKAAAKAAAASILQGSRGHVVHNAGDAINILRLSSNPLAGAFSASVSDAAWEAHLADVRARIDSLP